MTKACPVHHFAEESPDRTALRFEGTLISYKALDQQIDEVASALVSSGIKAGMRIGLYLQSSPQYIVVLWALFRLKVVAVPLNTRLPKSKAYDQLVTINAEICITDHSDADRPARAGINVFDLQNISSQTDATASYTGVHKTFSVTQSATILFTSGSTGEAKAVLHTWGNHYFSALGSNQNIILEAGDTWLLSLPLYHVAGMSVLFRCFLAGASIAIPGAGVTLVDALTTSNVSHVSLVATQLLRLLDAVRDRPIDALKALLIGGSAIPATLIERAHTAGWPVHLTYGMTEMASQVTTTSSGAMLEERLTSGSVLPFRKVRISAENEICVGGEVCFAGYVEGDVVKPSLDSAGYFHTGDLGYIDKAGLLHVKGRRDNMFISGGENIHPEEIEKTLTLFPAINRALVVPVPDHEFGVRPVAFIQLGKKLASSGEITAFLRTRLPGYMLPIAYIALPDEEGLKPSRARLAEMAVALIKET